MFSKSYNNHLISYCQNYNINSSNINKTTVSDLKFEDFSVSH